MNRTATPALEGLLHRLRRRVTALIWMHGLGTAIGAGAAWLAFAFLADWILHVPRGVRWVQLGLLFGIPAFLLVRELFRPLRARPDRVGLAVLLERAYPELRQLLVTATENPRGDPEIVAGILGDAEKQAATLEPMRALDPRGPRLRLLLGAAATVLCTVLLAVNADAARIFFARMAGGDTPWPQRTHLTVEIPLPERARIASDTNAAEAGAPTEVVVRVARGSDVPILVRALGKTPDEVVLHFKGGQRSVLSATGDDAFRTVLRAVQEDVEFFATGGDDQDEDSRARLIVLQPPDVAGIAVEIEPPAYSGLAPRTEHDRDVEALAGSRLLVHVLPDPPDATGNARLLPEDRTIALVARTFPGLESAAAPDATAAATSPGLAFELVAEKTLRFRVELVDKNGLSNPDPGLFGITVVEDRAPEVEILSPGRGDVDTTPAGLIALRARAEDDFGITRMSWALVTPFAATGPSSTSDSGSAATSAPAAVHELEWRPVERALQPAAGDTVDGAGSRTDERIAHRPARALALARARLEVRELAGADSAGAGAGGAVVEGQQFHLVVAALDNRKPEAREGRSSVVRIHVASPEEFLRRVQDRLARVRSSAATLLELQREKQRGTSELLSSLESDQLLGEDRSSEIAAALTGQRRVQGDARALSREVASIVESVLYARIDERAGAFLDFVDARLDSADRAFDPGPWRELVSAFRAGTLGQSGLAGRLVGIAGIALDVSEDEAAGASAELLRAQDALDLKAVHDSIASAAAHQHRGLDKLEELLEMLAEWDNYQSVLSLTRDILNGQKSLSERTRQFAKEH